MPRFFKENLKESPNITGQDAAHIIRVLRMSVGDTLVVSDTAGTDYTCKILSADPANVELEIIESRPNATEAGTSLTLFQCLPKSDKMDLIVRQATEIGVKAVVPVLSERCVSRPDSKSIAKKIDRWQKIAAEAAGQSGRGVIPKVQSLLTFEECTKELQKFDLSIFFCERGGFPLKDLIKPQHKNIAIVIGPEGGFSLDEEATANAACAASATLGKRILRCETAPLVAAACVLQLCGEMD